MNKYIIGISLLVVMFQNSYSVGPKSIRDLAGYASTGYYGYFTGPELEKLKYSPQVSPREMLNKEEKPREPSSPRKQLSEDNLKKIFNLLRAQYLISFEHRTWIAYLDEIIEALPPDLISLYLQLVKSNKETRQIKAILASIVNNAYAEAHTVYRSHALYK